MLCQCDGLSCDLQRQKPLKLKTSGETVATDPTGNHKINVTFQKLQFQNHCNNVSNKTMFHQKSQLLLLFPCAPTSVILWKILGTLKNHIYSNFILKRI